MESIVRNVNVRDIDAGDRDALEHVVGQALRDNHRLIIQIAEVDMAVESPSANGRQPQTLADWTKVFDGLSDDEVETIDRVMKSRANLTRNLP